MKIGFLISLLFFSYQLQAQTLQVPEDCLTTRALPCLAHVKSFTDKPFDLGTFFLMTSADTLMKWTDFDKEPSVELIKGKIEVRRAKNLRINGILVVSSYIMVHKVGDTLKIFDLKSFMVSEYDLKDPKQPPVLTKNLFVDKAALVFLSAPFFKTKNKFLGFLKVVEKPFSKKLQAQAEAQTNVLKRALASVEEENKEAALKKTAEEAKLKKVRELFFYRTFYR